MVLSAADRIVKSIPVFCRLDIRIGYACAPQRHLLSKFVFGLQFALLFFVSFAAAQPQEGGNGSRDSTNAALNKDLESLTSPLDAAIYLEGPEGKIFVPNVKLQDLQEYKESISGVRGAPFQFSDIQIEGTANSDYLDLTGAFQVELGPRTQKAEIPLKFGACQIGINAPEIDSEGTVSQFFADASGYRWILLVLKDASDKTSSHRISLAGKCRIARESERRSIRIPLPQHPTRLVFNLPAGAQDIRARQDEIVSQQATDSAVRVTIDSLGGDFTLSWRENTSISGLATIEADSATSFTVVDLSQPWRATTNINLDWYGPNAPSTVTLQLPPGAQWRTLPQSGFGRYSITSLDPRELSVDAPQGAAALLQIENFDPAETTSISVQLEWIWSPNLEVVDKLNTKVGLAVPTIDGVSLHNGTLDCTFQSQFSALFQTGAGAQLLGLRRLSDGTGNQQLRFSFTREDIDIGLTLRREESAPTVRPTYLVQVDRNKLVMTAWLACSFDVNHRIQLGINFGDWRIQENTARVLSNSEDLQSNEGDLLTVTTESNDLSILRGRIQDLATSSRSEQIWKIVAEKSWTPDENGELEFRLPVISRFQVGGGALVDHTSGALIVAAADNLALQWNDVQSSGLLGDSYSTEYQRYFDSANLRSPLAYRFQARGNTPTWAGRARLLPQVVTVIRNDRVTIARENLGLEQDFAIKIANSPLEYLHLQVDQAAIEAGLVVELNGTPLATQLLEEEASASVALTVDNDRNARRVLELVGLPELLGEFQLTVRTSFKLGSNGEIGELTDQNLGLADANTLPLVNIDLPNGETVDRRFLSYAVAEGMQATLQAGEALIDKSEEQFLVQGDASIELNVLQASDAESLAQVRVDRSWLQTAIDGDQRRDRFVAEISSSADQIYFYLPEKAYARNPKPQIILDGVPIAAPFAEYDSTQDRYIVRLKGSIPNQKHVLEVFYSVRNNLSSWSTLEIYPPTIQDAEFTGRFYWQLATPKTTHLLWSPVELTDEWRWKWGGIFWHRDSVRSETGMVDLLGAYNWEQLPLSVNQYLMSGRFPTQPLKPTVVSRFIIWFPVGIVAIGLSTLVISYPSFRNPIYGFLFAGLIVSLGMLAPDVGILLGQTGIVAFGLVILVLTTQAAIESRIRRRSVFAHRGLNIGDASGQHSKVQSTTSPTVGPPTTEKLGSSVALQESGK